MRIFNLGLEGFSVWASHQFGDPAHHKGIIWIHTILCPILIIFLLQPFFRFTITISSASQHQLRPFEPHFSNTRYHITSNTDPQIQRSYPRHNNLKTLTDDPTQSFVAEIAETSSLWRISTGSKIKKQYVLSSLHLLRGGREYSAITLLHWSFHLETKRKKTRIFYRAYDFSPNFVIPDRRYT